MRGLRCWARVGSPPAWVRVLCLHCFSHKQMNSVLIIYCRVTNTLSLQLSGIKQPISMISKFFMVRNRDMALLRCQVEGLSAAMKVSL